MKLAQTEKQNTPLERIEVKLIFTVVKQLLKAVAKKAHFRFKITFTSILYLQFIYMIDIICSSSQHWKEGTNICKWTKFHTPKYCKASLKCQPSPRLSTQEVAMQFQAMQSAINLKIVVFIRFSSLACLSYRTS